MEKITKQKKVDYTVYVAYDGTEFSAETLHSDERAQEECKQYESSAKGIVASKALKVLKPYKVPGSDKLSLDNVPESLRKEMPEWRKRLFNPVNLAIKCIASELLTARWSCMEDIAEHMYIFKPKKQDDIDIVAQYCKINDTPIEDWVYKEEDYGKDLATILNHYNADTAGADGIKVGHTYIVIPVTDNKVTSVIDIEDVLGLWTELLKDVKENY